jgi:hypothetical protein
MPTDVDLGVTTLTLPHRGGGNKEKPDQLAPIGSGFPRRFSRIFSGARYHGGFLAPAS